MTATKKKKPSPILNDYVILTKNYCKNYKQLKFAKEKMNNAAVKQTLLAKNSEGAAKEYYENKAKFNEVCAEEIETLLGYIDAGLETLSANERKALQDLYIDHIPVEFIQGASRSSLFRAANRAVSRLAVCLFGAKAQLFVCNPAEIASDNFSLFLVNSDKWR